MRLEEKMQKIMVGFSNGNLLCVDREMLINTINYLLRKRCTLFLNNIDIFWSSDEDQQHICYPVEILDYSDDDYEENGAYWWLYNHTQYAPMPSTKKIIEKGITEYIDSFRNYISECQQNNILLVP